MREWQEEMFGLERRNRKMGKRDREVLEDKYLVLKQWTKETTADLMLKIKLERLRHLDAIFASQTGYDGNGRALVR